MAFELRISVVDVVSGRELPLIIFDEVALIVHLISGSHIPLRSLGDRSVMMPRVERLSDLVCRLVDKESGASHLIKIPEWVDA